MPSTLADPRVPRRRETPSAISRASSGPSAASIWTFTPGITGALLGTRAVPGARNQSKSWRRASCGGVIAAPLALMAGPR